MRHFVILLGIKYHRPRQAGKPLRAWLVQSPDFADYTELFRNFTEGTVLSVCSVYKNRVLSSDFATAMPLREGVSSGNGLVSILRLSAISGGGEWQVLFSIISEAPLCYLVSVSRPGRNPTS